MEARSSTWDLRKMELELPEEVDLQLEVANAGSRTLAILIDLGLCAVMLFTVYASTAILARDASASWITRLGANTLEILLFLLIFGSQWCYFNLFEWMWNGQTPGKRLLHLRVIKIDGTPVSWIDVLLRNLARPIDTFGPMGLIGLLMIFVSRKAQRLGDLMAQTLVIHETKIDWSIFDELKAADVPVKGKQAPAIRLSGPQWELLHRYLNRRGKLPLEVRDRLTQSVYRSLQPLAKGTDLERATLAPEEWLLELARRT